MQSGQTNPFTSDKLSLAKMDSPIPMPEVETLLETPPPLLLF
jgi:hypothetical protein